MKHKRSFFGLCFYSDFLGYCLVKCHSYFYIFREQYAKWKEQCCQMFPVIGSGRYITAPIITDDGQPIQDPLVLLEANPQKGSALPHDNGDAQDSELSTSNSSETKKPINHPPIDKKEIQWKLTLHQIGWWYPLLLHAYFSLVFSMFHSCLSNNAWYHHCTPTSCTNLAWTIHQSFLHLHAQVKYDDSKLSPESIFFSLGIVV